MKPLFKALETQNTYMLTSGCLYNIPEVIIHLIPMGEIIYEVDLYFLVMIKKIDRHHLGKRKASVHFVHSLDEGVALHRGKSRVRRARGVARRTAESEPHPRHPEIAHDQGPLRGQ